MMPGSCTFQDGCFCLRIMHDTGRRCFTAFCEVPVSQTAPTNLCTVSRAAVTRRQVLEKPVSAHVPSTTRSTHPGSGQYTPPSAVSSWPGVDADVVQHQQAADNSQALFYLPSVRHGGRRPLADEAACVVWLHLHVLEVLNSVADDDAVADIAASEWCSGVPNGFNQPLQSQLDQQPLPASEALAAASAGSCEASAQQQGVAAAQAAAGSPVGGPGDDSDAADVEPPSKRTCRRVPDFSLLDKPWTADGRLCVVGEAKRPEVMQHIGGDLVSKWNEQDSTAQQVVAQLNEYMQHYNTSYGCITSLAHTWLARRHPEHPAGLQVCIALCATPWSSAAGCNSLGVGAQDHCCTRTAPPLAVTVL